MKRPTPAHKPFCLWACDPCRNQMVAVQDQPRRTPLRKGQLISERVSVWRARSGNEPLTNTRQREVLKRCDGSALPSSGSGGLLFHDPLISSCDHHPQSRWCSPRRAAQQAPRMRLDAVAPGGLSFSHVYSALWTGCLPDAKAEQPALGCALPASGAPSPAWLAHRIASSGAGRIRRSCTLSAMRMGGQRIFASIQRQHGMATWL